MITDSASPKPDRATNASAKGGQAENPSPLDSLKSDEWWQKFQAGEPLDSEPGDGEEHPPKGGKAKN
jgi:hypothetical protein